MPRVRLEVQASGSAIEANLRGYEARLRREVQRLNRRRGERHYRRVYDATPVRSGFMRDALRFELTPNDFGYRVGWAPSDFAAAGHYPYYRVVLFGSRTVAGDDFFSPIAREERRAYLRELREITRRAGTRRRGR